MVKPYGHRVVLFIVLFTSTVRTVTIYSFNCIKGIGELKFSYFIFLICLLYQLVNYEIILSNKTFGDYYNINTFSLNRK